MKRILFPICLILLSISLFLILSGANPDINFNSFLQVISQVPVPSFDWLSLPSISVPSDPLGILTPLVTVLNVIIDIANFALLCVRAFLKLFTFAFYFLKVLLHI